MRVDHLSVFKSSCIKQVKVYKLAAVRSPSVNQFPFLERLIHPVWLLACARKPQSREISRVMRLALYPRCLNPDLVVFFQNLSDNQRRNNVARWLDWFKVHKAIQLVSISNTFELRRHVSPLVGDPAARFNLNQTRAKSIKEINEDVNIETPMPITPVTIPGTTGAIDRLTLNTTNARDSATPSTGCVCFVQDE